MLTMIKLSSCTGGCNTNGFPLQSSVYTVLCQLALIRGSLHYIATLIAPHRQTVMGRNKVKDIYVWIYLGTRIINKIIELASCKGKNERSSNLPYY